MPRILNFYSVNEVKKPTEERVFHDNRECASGRDIRTGDRVIGTGGYRHCDDYTTDQFEK